MNELARRLKVSYCNLKANPPSTVANKQGKNDLRKKKGIVVGNFSPLVKYTCICEELGRKDIMRIKDSPRVANSLEEEVRRLDPSSM